MKETIKFLTLDMLLELPSKIIGIVKEPTNEYIAMLDESTWQKYYYSNLRNDLLKLFNEFNESKYLFTSTYFSCTANYEIKENQHKNNTSDKVGNYVINKIDKEQISVDIYNRITDLARKLTMQEAVYFVNTFFARNSEETISEKLNISRTYLQKIKKSCLVKMYFQFLDLLNIEK